MASERKGNVIARGARALWRLVRHRWAEPAGRRVLPQEVLQRLEAGVARSERLHTGQIRIVAEAGLPWSYLRRHATARERAIMLFSKFRVWDTEHNNGVLIYLLIPEHAIEIVADRGLARHVTPAECQRVVAQMSAEFRAARYEEGLAQALDVVTHQLVQHFPRRGKTAGPADSVANELPDAPILQ